MRRLVVGHGYIGAALAERLVDRGDDVAVATRDGRPVAGARSLASDAADPDALAADAAGCDTIFVCTNPPYSDWPRLWPPMFAAAIAAARASGAGLVLMGNLYPYGEPRGPMTEASPELTTETKGMVRRDGWAQALAAHRRGDIRAVEVRASDYFGARAGATAHLGARFFVPILASKTARVIGDPDVVHSWSYLPDIVTTLVAAADHDGEWGRVWHVPSGEPHARTEIARQVNEGWNVHGSVAGLPMPVLRLAGIFNPLLREVAASAYQVRMPFVIDSAETERALGVEATPWAEALAVAVESYRTD